MDTYARVIEMQVRIFVGLLVCVVGCGFPQPKDVVGDGGGSSDDAAVDAPSDAPTDADIDAPLGACNPLTQTGCAAGEKCTWLIDTVMPQYTGHIGCAPNGSAATGATCTFGAAGATGYDDCAKGSVCSAYRQPGQQGVCKQICDHEGGTPMCDGNHVCLAYDSLFATGSTQPPAAGTCDPACNPLAANDFDGSGSSFTRSSNTCGSADWGCYGAPSNGTPPATRFTCAKDLNYTAPAPGLRHRVQCTTANNCVDGTTVYVNSCNQGYLPLLRESTGVSTLICVALCKPTNCYLGNCGTNSANRLGLAPHTCSTSSAVGTFNTATNGEHCTHFWIQELDGNGNLLESPYSDTVGYCLDHSKYQYDSDNDGTPDTAYPACKDLAIMATGMDPANPLTYFGAVDFGCVDTMTAGLPFTGKTKIERTRRAVITRDFRPLYTRTSGSP